MHGLSDYTKLMAICNSYGLDENQTNELIAQFQSSPDQSELTFSKYKCDHKQSSSHIPNQSLTSDISQSEHSFQEYSFKHANQNWQKLSSLPQPTQQQDQDPNTTHKESISFDHTLEKQNELLRRQIQRLRRMHEEYFEKSERRLEEKNKQINDLITMNKNNTEIIKGLKDCLVGRENSQFESNLKSSAQISEREVENKDTLIHYINPLGDITHVAKNDCNTVPPKEQTVEKKRGNGRKCNIDISRYKCIIENLKDSLNKKNI